MARDREYLWAGVNDTRMGRYLMERELALLERVLEGTPPGRVLDVGCGDGRLYDFFRAREWAYVGVDPDPAPLATFARRWPDAHLICGDGRCLNAGATFDVVVCLQVVDYVLAKDAFLGRLSELLRTGGSLVLSFSNRASIKGLVYGAYSRRRYPESLRQARTYYALTCGEYRALAEPYFTWGEARGANWNLLPRDSDSPLVTVAAAVERTLGLRRLPAWSPMVLAVLRPRGREHASAAG